MRLLAALLAALALALPLAGTAQAQAFQSQAPHAILLDAESGTRKPPTS